MYDKVEIMKALMILSKILDIPFSWKEEQEPEPKRLQLLDFSMEPEPKRLQAFWWRLPSPDDYATFIISRIEKKSCPL